MTDWGKAIAAHGLWGFNGFDDVNKARLDEGLRRRIRDDLIGGIASRAKGKEQETSGDEARGAQSKPWKICTVDRATPLDTDFSLSRIALLTSDLK